MSAYKIITVEAFVMKDILLEALRKMGLKPRVYETPQPLQGVEGRNRANRAEIVVPRSQLNKLFTGASNDLGFAYNQETHQWDMIASDYDVALKVPDKVVQAYAAVALAQQMEENSTEVEWENERQLQRRGDEDVLVIGWINI